MKIIIERMGGFVFGFMLSKSFLSIDIPRFNIFIDFNKKNVKIGKTS